MITTQADTDGSEQNGCRARVEVSVAGATLTASLSGELDRLNAADVIPLVGDAVTAGTSCLVLDLGRLTFIDSSGIHALVQLHRTLGTEGIAVRLAVSEDAAVRRTLEVANVFHLIGTDGAGEVENGPGWSSFKPRSWKPLSGSHGPRLEARATSEAKSGRPDGRETQIRDRSRRQHRSAWRG